MLDFIGLSAHFKEFASFFSTKSRKEIAFEERLDRDLALVLDNMRASDWLLPRKQLLIVSALISLEQTLGEGEDLNVADGESTAMIRAVVRTQLMQAIEKGRPHPLHMPLDPNEAKALHQAHTAIDAVIDDIQTADGGVCVALAAETVTALKAAEQALVVYAVPAFQKTSRVALVL